MFGYIAIACMLGVATAAPSLGYAAVEHDAHPRYNFNYAVSDPHTGDYKSQSEHREGGVVKGSYSVAEADGTLRVVDYAADPVTGFHADVKRLGHAAHPQIIKPVIHAPIVPAYSAGLIGHGGWSAQSSWGGPAWAGLSSWGGHGALGGLGGWGLGYSGLGLGNGLGGHGLGLGSHGLGLGGHGLGLGGHGAHGIGYGH